jgi:hypothetical protein
MQMNVCNEQFVEKQLTEACESIHRDDPALAAEVLAISRGLYFEAWEAGIKTREPWDNHTAHELRVWGRAAPIAWASGRNFNPAIRCTKSDLTILCVCSFFHDLYPFRRVVEEAIAAAPADQKKLKKAQKMLDRLKHMGGGAEKAQQRLSKRPDLVTAADLRPAVGYIGMHDACKIGCPYPLASDSLAVYFFEADVAWPLDPEFGPLADLQRKGIMNPDREALLAQARSNFENQLLAYPRSSFGAVMESFRGGTLMRTAEGAKILAELLRYWEIDLPVGL